MSNMPTGAMATTKRSRKSLMPTAICPRAKAVTMTLPCRWMEAHSAGRMIGARMARPPKLNAKKAMVTTDQILMATLARRFSKWSWAFATGSRRRNVLRSTGPR